MALLATPQDREVECSSNAEGLDRFSNLPGHIIHHIFSFLSFQDTARVGVLSKTCWSSFLSYPYLMFTSSCYESDDSLDSCKQLSDRVDRLLSKRNGSEMCSFTFHSSCALNKACDFDANLLAKWINVAVSCGVQEINLSITNQYPTGHRIFELPQCIFSSKTLRILKLCLFNIRFKDPPGVFVWLEELSLYSIAGYEHDVNKLISTACPSLKRLTIKDPYRIQNLSISSPCLEELTLVLYVSDDTKETEIDISTERLQKLSLDLRSLMNTDDCTINVNAPNLQDLKWKAGASNNVCLSRFKFLKNATLSIWKCILNANKVNYLLQRVRSARTLTLNLDVLESQFLRNCPSVEFSHLQYLVIMVNYMLKDYQFPVFASALSMAPNLEYLSLKCRIGCSWSYESLYVKKSMASVHSTQHERVNNQIGHQPKAIEIELRGEGHQVGVIKSMLEFAKGLKKMTIFYSKQYSESLSEIGLHNSRTTASLPFEVKLVEKEYTHFDCHYYSG